MAFITKKEYESMLQVCNNPDVLSLKYLEERLKLTVNREKSRTVSVFAI